MQDGKIIFFCMKHWQKVVLRGKVEREMVQLAEGSSVKESPEDKQASTPCIRGGAKISRRVTLALHIGKDMGPVEVLWDGDGVPSPRKDMGPE